MLLQRITQSSYPDAQIDDEFVTGRMQERQSITLQGIRKRHASVYIIVAPIGKVIEFGTLPILVHRYLQSAPEDQPESKAFIYCHFRKEGGQLLLRKSFSLDGCLPHPLPFQPSITPSTTFGLKAVNSKGINYPRSKDLGSPNTYCGRRAKLG